MLNLIAIDEDDRNTLKRSYQLIADYAEIVTDEAVVKSITSKVSNFLTIPNGAVFSLQNLFKINLPEGNIFIAQCLLDYGYPVNGKMTISQTRVYTLQVIGFAELTVNLGTTILRPETKLDKLIGRFWGKGIKFDGAEKFNKKYYLVSNDKAAVQQHFDIPFVNTIANCKNILISNKSSEMAITFEAELQVGHSKIILDVFKKCKFIVNQ